jgi:hypothetical protein
MNEEPGDQDSSEEQDGAGFIGHRKKFNYSNTITTMESYPTSSNNNVLTNIGLKLVFRNPRTLILRKTGITFF